MMSTYTYDGYVTSDNIYCVNYADIIGVFEAIMAPEGVFHKVWGENDVKWGE